MLATTASGVLMSAVHILANRMEEAEYGVFFALLRVFVLMGFPAAGLQIVFARHAAAAVTDPENRKLAGETRAVLRGTVGVWLVMALIVLGFQGAILSGLKIANPAALWLTVFLGLASLLSPVFKGLLQGRQHFAGFGWMLLADAVGRFVSTAIILQMGGQAAGAMCGAIIGQVISLGIGFWLTREVWAGPGNGFAWRPWFRQVIPLAAGAGSVLLMTSVDVIFVQTLFSKENTPFYMAGAMIGYALVIFTTPLAAVMFPKVARSAALLQRTNAIQQTLIATACVGGAAALLCTFLPELPLRIIYFRKETYWKSAPLVPWFAWSLLPLIVANVLAGSLLAQGRYRAVPWMVLVAASYTLVLISMRGLLAGMELFAAFKLVIVTLGVFGLLLLLVLTRFSSVPDTQGAGGAEPPADAENAERRVEGKRRRTEEI
jgi:O-antigen/teichoic acid export membrane protein